MIYVVSSWVFMVVTLVICIACNHPNITNKTSIGKRGNFVFCGIIFLAGCFCRLWMLDKLPSGLTAEEALIGAQGKALWQLGGFYPSGKLTAQLPYWTGESVGPFLAVLTAPFVGLFGSGAWAVRLPLALLSIVAMLAMYGVGKELGDERLGRMAMGVCALCPCFVLDARLTTGANAALYLLPIAIYLVLLGMRKPLCLYPGMILLAMTGYTSNIYLFIAPLLVIAAFVMGLLISKDKVHVLIAGILGVFAVMPALLTVIVNFTNSQPMLLFGMIEIPKLQDFEKLAWLGSRMKDAQEPLRIALNQFFTSVFTGATFGNITHENIGRGVLSPEGFYVLYLMSLPLILLGILLLIRRCFEKDHANKTVRLKWGMVTLFWLMSVIWVVLFGSIGAQNIADLETSCYDYASLFFYNALLMSVAMARIGEKSQAGITGIMAMLGISFCLLCTYVFGGEYGKAMNVAFPGFREAARYAETVHSKTGYDICVTDRLYPHINPDQAAEMMTLLASNANMREPLYFSIEYPGAIDELRDNEIYLMFPEDTFDWNIDAFDYVDFGGFVVLTPY